MKQVLTTILLMLSAAVSAQKGTVKGIVTDKATGEEIIGANVFIEGTTIGAATDIFGAFQ